MKTKLLLSLIALTFFPMTSFAADNIYICKSLEGTRVDYFLKNTLNVPNNEFSMSRDKVAASIKLTISEDQKAVALDVVDANGNTAMSLEESKIFFTSPEQISFSGILSGAPMMATYYFAMNVLTYSQQSVWPTGDFEGVRAFIFYGKCEGKKLN